MSYNWFLERWRKLHPTTALILKSLTKIFWLDVRTKPRRTISTSPPRGWRRWLRRTRRGWRSSTLGSRPSQGARTKVPPATSGLHKRGFCLLCLSLDLPGFSRLPSSYDSYIYWPFRRLHPTLKDLDLLLSSDDANKPPEVALFIIAYSIEWKGLFSCPINVL